MEALRVLIVDDEALTRTILRARLEKLGHTIVAEAENGRQAVELAAEHKPEAVLMDIRMPELDGIEAAKLISESNPCAILFLSALSEDTMIERAGEAGALCYLMKPFRKEDLGPALEIAVKRFRDLRNQKEEIASLKESLESRKVVERAKGILMKRDGLTEDEAFKKIHFQARNANKKMKEIAEGIIAGTDQNPAS